MYKNSTHKVRNYPRDKLIHDSLVLRALEFGWLRVVDNSTFRCTFTPKNRMQDPLQTPIVRRWDFILNV